MEEKLVAELLSRCSVDFLLVLVEGSQGFFVIQIEVLNFGDKFTTVVRTGETLDSLFDRLVDIIFFNNFERYTGGYGGFCSWS